MELITFKTDAYPQSLNDDIKPVSAPTSNYQRRKAQRWCNSPETSHRKTSKKRLSRSLPGDLAQSQAQSKHFPSSYKTPSTCRKLMTELKNNGFLYEKDLSQTIAIIAWLFTRDMTLRKGYFYREDLVKVVHCIMSPLLKSRFVSATRINHCLHLIIRSSFQYTLLREEETEESRYGFSKRFASSISNVDDEFTNAFLNSLPSRWKKLDFNLAINTEICIQSNGNEESLEMKPAKGDMETNQKGQRKLVSKALYPLDNVRSLKSLLVNHDERIRDLADQVNLNLTDGEWCLFFFGKTDEDSHGRTLRILSDTDESKSSSSMKSTFERPTKVSLAMKHRVKNPSTDKEISSTMNTVVPVKMDSSETSTLFKEKVPGCRKAPGSKEGLLGPRDFRTTWCCKTYKHDLKKCIFAHPIVNGGWLRRDPRKHDYKPIFCLDVSIVRDNTNHFVYDNACKIGKTCQFAHSQEEIDYHPSKYRNLKCKFLPCDENLCTYRRFSPSSEIVPQEADEDKGEPAVSPPKTFSGLYKSPLYIKELIMKRMAPGLPFRRTIESYPKTIYVRRPCLPYFNDGKSVVSPSKIVLDSNQSTVDRMPGGHIQKILEPVTGSLMSKVNLDPEK